MQLPASAILKNGKQSGKENPGLTQQIGSTSLKFHDVSVQECDLTIVENLKKTRVTLE